MPATLPAVENSTAPADPTPAAQDPTPTAPPAKRPVGRPRIRDRATPAATTGRLLATRSQDGKRSIDWSRTSVDELRELLASPEAQERLGLATSSTAKPARPSSLPQAVPQIVNMANAAALPVLASQFKLTPEEAAKHCILARDEEKFKNICARASEELEKVLPGGFGRWDNLVAIAADLMTFSAEAVVAIRNERAEKRPGPQLVTRPFTPPDDATAAPVLDDIALSAADI